MMTQHFIGPRDSHADAMEFPVFELLSHWVQTPGSNGSLLEANQHLRRIGPKSNTEPTWTWGSARPLFIDARKSNE